MEFRKPRNHGSQKTIKRQKVQASHWSIDHYPTVSLSPSHWTKIQKGSHLMWPTRHRPSIYLIYPFSCWAPSSTYVCITPSHCLGTSPSPPPCTVTFIPCLWPLWMSLSYSTCVCLPHIEFLSRENRGANYTTLSNLSLCTKMKKHAKGPLNWGTSLMRIFGYLIWSVLASLSSCPFPFL